MTENADQIMKRNVNAAASLKVASNYCLDFIAQWPNSEFTPAFAAAITKFIEFTKNDPVAKDLAMMATARKKTTAQLKINTKPKDDFMDKNREHKERLLDFYEEASRHYDEGKSKQQVANIFLAKGLPQELAETIASQGMIHNGSKDNYLKSKADEIVDDSLFKHTKEAAYLIDEGNSREQIVAKFISLDMPQPLAEKIVFMGAELLQSMVKDHKDGVIKRGLVIGGLGLAFILACYFYETETSFFYLIGFGLVILGCWVYARGDKQTAARYPHWPEL
ncbi:hypothetical protein [Methylotenera sp.]|uniref:hypothetical protein n=1 Tax=Methylotenera sp. TaxID=2051956 RepID=UPI002735242C|nr:hypothetical protein [Methylotenera sp.]MDP3006628.1 hypothetical protein [Methylotenera sp.]